MTSIRGQVEIDMWDVEELIAATSKNIKSNKEITIPPFQRGLVWDKKRQEDLIDSIRNGYPIGTLLLYEVSNKSNGHSDVKRSYNLIDGLQRTNALKQYTSSPNTYFSMTEYEDPLVEFLARELNQHTEEGKDAIRRVITNWIKGVSGFSLTDGFEPSGMTRALISEVLNVPPETDYFTLEVGKYIANSRFQKKLLEFLETVSRAADISKVKVPVIIFTGDDTQLPAVFERLNTRSTVLSRYEVFAAQWVKKTLKIHNKSIRDAIWEKYSALEDENFTSDAVQDAPDDKRKKEHNYTLFEYLFGFGRYLSSKFPRLFGETSEDRPSSIGFNLMCACVGLQINRMTRLPDRLSGKSIRQLEDFIIESTEFVERTLDPVLSVKQQKEKKSPIYHTEYQIISMIVTALNVRYDSDTLQENSGWRADRTKLGKHLLMYYLYDILRGYWRGSGDSKLHDMVQNDRYLNPPPTSESWRIVFNTWFDDNQLTLLHKGRYVRDQNPEILLLKYIYATKFNLIQGAKAYHLEHIIPVAQLQEAKDKDARWPINTIGNLALLEAGRNLEKSDKTFLEFLKKKQAKGELTEDEFVGKFQEWQDLLICKAQHLPESLNRESFEDFLRNRWSELKNEFLTVWRDHIPADPQN